MKKFLIAMLVGITMVSAVGCSNNDKVKDTKEVAEEKQEVAEEKQEEKTKAEKLNEVINAIKEREDFIFDNMNTSEESNAISSYEVKYDELNDVITFEYTMTFKEVSDENMVIAIERNKGSLDKTIKNMKEDYEYILGLLELHEVDGTEIVIKEYIGKYKVAEYNKDGDVYRLDD